MFKPVLCLLLVSFCIAQEASTDAFLQKVARREGILESELQQYYASRWESFKDIAPPILASDSGLQIGMIGIVESNDELSEHSAPLLIVKQVVSDTEAIVLARSPRTNGSMEFDLLLKGPKTADFTVGNQVYIKSHLVKVTGAYRYTTVLGASRQIHQIEVDSKPILRHPIQLGFGEIEWLDASGKLIKKGAFQSFEKGVITILDRDLQSSQIRLSELSNDSKKTAQALIREQSDKARAEQVKKRQSERRQGRN